MQLLTSYTNSIAKFNRPDQKQLALYPDTIPYDLDTAQYKQAIQQLMPSDNKSYYYYVKDHDIQLVSRSRYQWERMRGFFGFTNHCKTKKVTLTLLKLAYYGQSQGHDISQIKTIPFIKNFSNDTLKDDLVKYYNNHHVSIQSINQNKRSLIDPLNQQYIFGDTLMWLGSKELAKMAMRINTTDIAFAKKHANQWIKLFEYQEEELNELTKNTQIHRQAIAQAYLLKMPMFPNLINMPLWELNADNALRFNANIAIANPTIYFYYYINKKEFETAAQLYTVLSSNEKINKLRDIVIHLFNSNQLQPIINLLKNTSNKQSFEVIAQEYIKKSMEQLTEIREGLVTSLVNKSLKSIGSMFSFGASPTVPKIMMSNYKGWEKWYQYAKISIMLDETIESTYALYFAEYFKNKNNFEKSFNYIQKIASIDDQYLYITQSGCMDNFRDLIPKNSELAVKLAAKYIVAAKKDKDAATKLENLSSWQIDPELYFNNYIKDARYDEAYQIFLQIEDRSRLPKDKIKSLAAFFFEQANSSMTDLLTSSERYAALEQSVPLYEKSALLANEYKETYFKYKRELIDLSIGIDEKLQKANCQSYATAISMYQQLFDAESYLYDDRFTASLLSAYDKLITLLIEDICDEKSICNGVSASSNYKSASENLREQAKFYLTQAITIMNKLNDSQHNELLAKFNFILGDLKTFFGEMNGIDHLNIAAKLVPNNPFYKAYSADIGDQLESSDLVDHIIDVFEHSELHPRTYHFWKEERWHQHKNRSKDLPSIHDVRSHPPTSIFNFSR